MMEAYEAGTSRRKYTTDPHHSTGVGTNPTREVGTEPTHQGLEL